MKIISIKRWRAINIPFYRMFLSWWIKLR